jgi:hypothetical protein
MIMKTILLDTVEQQPSAKRVTPLDVEMVDECEKVLEALANCAEEI